MIGAPHALAGYGTRRISRSRFRVHNGLAGTSDDLAAEVNQANRYECCRPREELFGRPAKISYESSRFRRFA